MAVIYAIPGLGCNKWIYENLKVKGHSIKVLDWPPVKRHFTLKDYANEFLKQMDLTHEFYLMGVSFGGMLCIELGEVTEPEKIILISSAKNKNEFPNYFSVFKYFPVHLLLPESLHRKIALLSWKLLGFHKGLLPEFNQMIKSMPENHFRYCINYIVNWDRKSNSKPVIHIHGNGDKLLKYHKIKNVNYTVSNGSHAMVFTRSGEINQILEEILIDSFIS